MGDQFQYNTSTRSLAFHHRTPQLAAHLLDLGSGSFTRSLTMSATVFSLAAVPVLPSHCPLCVARAIGGTKRLHPGDHELRCVAAQ